MWTWADGQPSAGACAVQGSTGRWSSAPCGPHKAVACLSPKGWTVGKSTCKEGTFSVPRYGWEAVQLTAAMARAGVTEVVLALRLKAGRWTPLDAR